jgi:hypothetical protein
MDPVPDAGGQFFYGSTGFGSTTQFKKGIALNNGTEDCRPIRYRRVLYLAIDIVKYEVKNFSLLI